MPLQRMDSRLEFSVMRGEWMYGASDGYVEDGEWYVGMYGMYGSECMLNIQPIWLRMSMYECVQQR